MGSLNLNTCKENCLECVKKYGKKHTLKKGQKFAIKCRGIPKKETQLSLLDSLPEEDRVTAQAMLDPVIWAAQTLDWHCTDPDGSIWKRKNPKEYENWVADHPGEDILGHSRYHRPYQAEMLKCTARRKVFRIGRQCLTGNTEVFLSNGLSKCIKDISEGDEVLSINDENQMVPSEVTGQWSTGKKKVFCIHTKFGHQIKCTSDHRFLIINDNIDKYHGYIVDNLPRGWLSIDTGLREGSKIAVPFSIPHPDTERIGELAPFLGYFLADGSCSRKQSAKFTNITMEYLLDFELLAKELGTQVKWYTKGNGYDLILSNGRGQPNPVRELLAELGLTNITGPDKFIPDCIMNAPIQDTILFLRNFWAADGYVSTFQRAGRNVQRTEIGTLQESHRLIIQLQKLLWRFGVHSYIKQEENCYRLVASNKASIQNFLVNIGPIQGKENACQKALDNIKYVTDKYCNVSGDILWDYVSRIEELEEEETWDIEVENTHNFIANGMITHNCGKSEAIVVSMLYHMFTKPGIPESEGFEIVVIAPYQAQIDIIFDRLLQLIRSSPITNNSLRRNVKAPVYQIQLHNESKCLGFTAGTKSGGNADAVRGQHAHMLVFDEADYLAAGDMDSALSIITNYPTASMWMSSTPSGKREKFYQTCSSTLFKEFFFPSQANPMWDSSMEQLFKEQLTEIGFKHEVLAEFGEQEEGVFQNVYVQAAKAEYKYGDLPHQNTWTYSFGVDWNDVKNGTTIVVLGFNPSTKTFMIVDRHTVSREGWTQLSACQKIADLNRIWRPSFIYLDSGYGSTQWEVLRKYGYDSTIDPNKGPCHPDSRLKDIVVRYDFGSKVEVRDLWTHQPVQKDAKPFLVESTVRRFESGDIKFSDRDELLERQLLGYIIDRVTPVGRPVYKANDETAGDHILDGLMLAVIAFTMEVSPLGKPKYSSRICFSGHFGAGQELIHEGDTVIRARSPKEQAKEQREKQKPTMGRADATQQASLFSSNDLPASNTNKNSGRIGIWAWPGFSRDEKKPDVRSLALAGEVARRRVGLRPRMGSRPRRKNI